MISSAASTEDWTKDMREGALNCEQTRHQLSGFLDRVLETDQEVRVSQHLGKCVSCRQEFERLSTLRAKLRELRKPQAPDYLYHLVQLRLRNARQEAWRVRLRDELQYCWLKIRTTERLWYLTRVLGTAMTAVFFSYALNPIYVDFRPLDSDRLSLVQAYRQQLGISVLRNLGMNPPLEAQRRPIGPSKPRINDLYLLNFGQSVSQQGEDDTFSIVAVVDRSGSAKVQGVLEYPTDRSLLNDFNDMVSSARYRPALQNGHPVDSHLVMTFSKVFVRD
jgi:hypothetical protein